MNNLNGLRIAATQFPVSADMKKNAGYIERLSHQAADSGAHIVLFPETALPGYGPKHHRAQDGFDWKTLTFRTERICEQAKALNLWMIIGSMRKLKGEHPRNCLIVISNEGRIVGTYDKQRLYKSEKEFYSQGTDPLVLEIGGHRCGFLICYDNCYPELYEEYRSKGVGLLFHGIFNAQNSKATSISDLGYANMLTRAADHQMWIVASNSSARYSPFPAAIARPDGTMKKTKRHVTSLVLDDYPNAELGWTYDNRII